MSYFKKNDPTLATLSHNDRELLMKMNRSGASRR